MNKKEMVNKAVEILKTPKVDTWYTKNMDTKKQGNSIDVLNKAVLDKELTTYEALTLAFIIGYQWTVKFPGVP